jgi:hypothetical protein
MSSSTSCPHSASPRADATSSVASLPPNSGHPRLVDEAVLRAALEALDAVINCEPFADVSPPGTEGFDVYDVVAAARERVAEALDDADAG